MTEQADVIVVGMGPGGEDVAGAPGRGRPRRRRHRRRAGRGGVPLLGLRALQDDDPCRRSAGRGGTGPRDGRGGDGAARLGAGGPSHPRRGHRLLGRHGGGGALRGQGRPAGTGLGRLEGPSRVAVGDRSSRPAGPWSSISAPGPGYHRWPGWPARPTGPTAKPSRPRRCRPPWSSWAAGPSASSWPRCSGASAPRSPSSRPRRTWSGRKSPRRAGLLAEVFESEGIAVRVDLAVESVHHDGHRFAVAVGDGEPLVAERLLVATGRRADLAQLNVASIGLDESAPALPVDDHLRVAGTEGVWAVGDVTGKGAFTHVSMYQADIVVNDILGRTVVPADYRAVPRVTFTDPEIGSVGIHRAGGPPAGPGRPGGHRRGPQVGPGVDPQGGQRGVHQAGGGRRPGRAGRGHLGRPRGAVRCSGCSPWPSTPRCRPASSAT